ncbi:sigma-54-dependent transcriptional regulator [Maridesulfovibrio zosterae]|uniref:sigma-54-dependent transcriptional regulator n=1 Tax=Maridesulfovibrio zosterae TaxID=82171 RepID=UPI00040D0439|nr:sigma-54 dependent transcriptional regulator [Maridesulfovibrio zosterae]
MRKILVITRGKQQMAEVSKEFESKHTVVHNSDLEPSSSPTFQDGIDTVVIDINTLIYPSLSIDQALKELWEKHPSASVIVVAQNEQSHQAVEAVKAGAFDYLTHPVGKEELELVIDKVHEADIRHSELDYLRDQFWGDDYKDVVKTKSKSMREVLRKVKKVAATGTTVLISGETGTGKNLIARLIHAHSDRKDTPFINIHCGAIPESLVESELFGHEKGAFTGAIKRKMGKFELANSGTILLDEIGTISSTVQVKLLDILQERYVQRVGGETSIPLNVRVIAATNEDLYELSCKGEFRRDLFYRLNVFPIILPPLRERKEDIIHLSEIFIAQFNTQLNKNIKSITPEAIEAFLTYDWPGNVRELENIIERACILETGDTLTSSSLPIEFLHGKMTPLPDMIDTTIQLGQARQSAIDIFEYSYLTKLLTVSRGVIKEASRMAGITTRQLNKLMNKHKLERNQFVDGKK